MGRGRKPSSPFVHFHTVSSPINSGKPPVTCGRIGPVTTDPEAELTLYHFRLELIEH